MTVKTYAGAKSIEFKQYVRMLPVEPEPLLECTDDQLMEMGIRADEAPAGYYAAFECADRMHAAKVARRFRVMFPDGYMVVSSRWMVYVLAV
jgi:hypothetical protein